MTLSRIPAIALLAASLASAPPASADEEGITDGMTAVLPLGSLYYAHSIGDKEGRRQWLWATLSSEVVVSSLRLAFKDHEYATRPNGHPYGFPSGHMAFVIPSAAFLSQRYGLRYGIPAYLACGYIAWVRVDTDHHYWRDIASATAISWGLSQLFLSPYDQPHVQPMIGGDTIGVSVAMSW